MRSKLIICFVLCQILSSCSQEPIAESTPQPVPTETPNPTETPCNIEKTPTLTRTPLFPDVIQFTVLNEEINNDFDEERPLPVKEGGTWVLSNREGSELEIEVIEKSNDFNRLVLTTMGKKYSIVLSKGAILYLEIVGNSWIEYFFFSPDVGNEGAPIDCSRSGTYCYPPPSLVQLDIMDGNITKMIEEKNGWCVNPENIPSTFFVSLPYTNKYKVPSDKETIDSYGEVVEWTEDNCPISEITDVTQ